MVVVCIILINNNVRCHSGTHIPTHSHHPTTHPLFVNMYQGIMIGVGDRGFEIVVYIIIELVSGKLAFD